MPFTYWNVGRISTRNQDLHCKTIPVSKLILSNCLNCLDIPHTYSPKTLQNLSEQLSEEQPLTSASHRRCCSTFCFIRVLQISNSKVFLIGFYYPSIQSIIWLYRYDFKRIFFCSDKKQTSKKVPHQKLGLATELNCTVLSSLKSWY